MKTKKMIGGLFVAAAITVGIFYACKKPGGKTQTTTEQNVLAEQTSISSDRNTGTQTYYSTDNNGIYYKMILSWSASGVVTVNRSIVTSGYPAGTKNTFIVEEGISSTIVDLDPSTPLVFDTLKVSFSTTKKYYMISFKPVPASNGGGFAGYLGGGDSQPGEIVYCQCNSNAGGSCKLNRTNLGGKKGYGYYCTNVSCAKCNVVGSGCPRISGPFGDCTILMSPGCVLVEASNINIVN